MKSEHYLADIRKLVIGSGIYGIGSVIQKCILFLLIPIYTRVLSAEEYGILGVSRALIGIFSILFPLTLDSAIFRFYHDTNDINARKESNGSIWLVMITASLAMCILLNVFGRGLFTFFLPDIPFQPYFTLCLWISMLAVLGLTPQILFRTQERPIPFMALSLSETLLTATGAIIFVVFMRKGASGVLTGQLAGLGLMATPYIILTLRNVTLKFNIETVKAALAFSLPLIPHSLALWILQLSDRIVLVRFVPLNEVGIYSLGYQIGTIVQLFASAVNMAGIPFLIRILSGNAPHANKRVATLITYYVLLIGTVSLSVSIFLREILLIITPPAYHTANNFTHWIIGGQIMASLYLIPVAFMFLKKNTRLLPVASIGSGLINICMNLLLVPRYGIQAAAWSTFVTYSALFGFVFFLSNRIYKFNYEYGRIVKIFVSLLIVFIGSHLLHLPANYLGYSIKLVFLLTLPVVLFLIGFFTPEEKTAISRTVALIIERSR